MPRPIPPALPAESPSPVPTWLRRALLIGGILCLSVALIGFVVFALRAVTIA